MISLAVVEQIAKSCWPESEHAAISRPDPKKGEKLVLFTTQLEPNRKQLLASAKTLGLSELTVPREIEHIEVIPLLGTGKTDYISLNKIE